MSLIKTVSQRKALKLVRLVDIPLRKINIELAEINATKDKFFSIISHDLRSPLSGLMQVLLIIVEDYDSLENDEKQQMITDVANTSKRTYDVMENLLEWSSVQTGNIPFYPQEIALLELLTNLEAFLYCSIIWNSINLIAGE